MLRRILLGLATALIVMRMLVPADDDGRLGASVNPLALTIPLLWLLGLCGWAIWRWWSRTPFWYAGPVELGLGALVLCQCLSTVLSASHRHVAWILTWEWGGLFAAFFLIRQVGRRAADSRALLAALLATGVCVAGQSLVQRANPPTLPAPLGGLQAEDWARFRCQALATWGTAPPQGVPGTLSLGSLVLTLHKDDPTSFQRIPLRHNIALETGEPALPLALRPHSALPPAATFASLTSLAGLLALLVPALTGCVLATWWSDAPRWCVFLVLLCTGLVATALAWTLLRSALLPCLLVGAIAAGLAWRHSATHPLPRGPSPRGLLLLSMGGIATLVGLAFLLRSPDGGEFRQLMDRGQIAHKIALENLMFGVGPGNFDRHAPAHLTPSVEAEIAHPSNFLLETWAESGTIAAGMLVFALLAFFLIALRIAPPPLVPSEPTSEDAGTGWEFYEGGLIGLILGFALRAAPLSPEQIVDEGILAGARALLWFAVFALLNAVRWTGQTRVLACTAGVAALLFHLLVAGTLSIMGLAQPLLLMMALALNGVPENSRQIGQQWLGRFLPIPLTGALVLGFALQVFEPVTTAAGRRREALTIAQYYLDLRGHVYASRADGEVPRVRDPGHVLGQITTELTQASRADPLDPRIWVDLANWYGLLHEAFPTNPRYLAHALECARTAQRLDARGEAGYLAEAELLLRTTRPGLGPMDAMFKEFGSVAPTPLLKLADVRPHDAPLRYRVAEALWRTGDKELARIHARRALELDEAAPNEVRRLTPRQRAQLEEQFPGP